MHLSTEVKLPPQDLDAFEFLWKDSTGPLPKMRIPIFVRISWPDNAKMSGGGRLVERFNRTFNTEFAHDMPVDVVMALFYVMCWARQRSELLGIAGMRARLSALRIAASSPERPLLYPSTREIPNPEYTTVELLGMHLQYLAHLGDPEIIATVRQMLPNAPAAVRMGCAKAALEVGDRELFRYIVSSEPRGRMQEYMTRLVRRRKKRDLTDAEPRLLDEQYEFPAPLWTQRKGRVDPLTDDGQHAMAKLHTTGRLS